MLVQNINPVIFSWGEIHVRYYGLLFVLGIGLSFWQAQRLFHRAGYPDNDIWDLSAWIVVATLIGARLGHIIFYEPDYFWQNPGEIIFINHGGLASHGAALGIIVAYWLFIRWRQVSFWRYVDILAVVIPITAGFVRLGNFMNSEIVGRATNVFWAVKFPYYEPIPFPRHPSQLYEVALAFGCFFLVKYFYSRWQSRFSSGTTLGVFLLLYFVSRFLIEYVKDYPVLSSVLPLTMGQVLSLPFIVLSLIILVGRNRQTHAQKKSQ